ncbi:MAG: hypothetical protein K2X27_16935 [Candidatus Obscuribacterales bacterium]|nr:hypothetical protein [Candidatus Obscuribacterales bacterium]
MKNYRRFIFTLSLALLATSAMTESAFAQSAGVAQGQTKTYGGANGTASAGYSVGPSIKKENDTVIYGAAFNTFTSADLSNTRGGSLTGSGSSSGFVAADGSSASGSGSSNYSSTNSLGGSSSHSGQNSWTYGGSAANSSISAQSTNTHTTAKGQTLSWSVTVDKAAGQKANVSVSSSSSAPHAVCF